MSKYVLLECNRERAIDKSHDRSLKDDYKNKWSNQVSNSGIVINAGDVLSIEETIINTKGADSDVMEFRGEPNENNILDNKAQLEASYYICHTGKNTATMPFRLHKTYRGLGSLITPFVIDDTNNNRNQGVAETPFTKENFLQMISKRSLGETWFAGVGANQNGGQPYTNSPNNPFVSPDVIPQLNKIFVMKTIQRGGGLGATDGASNANSGFVEGDVYATSCRKADDSGAGSGAGMQIRVDTTISVGSVPNIIETFTITNFGTASYTTIGDVIIMNVGSIDGVAQGTDQKFEVISQMNPSYMGSDVLRYDGAKYYPLNVGFTGLVSADDARIDNGTTGFDFSAQYDVDKGDNSPTKRTNTIELEIPKGFSTPSVVSGVLTDQISRPEKLTETYNKGDFLDLKDFGFRHVDNIFGETEIGKPNIIASKVYQPHPCNFVNNAQGILGSKEASFSGRRSAFYQSIAWLEPERFTSLIPAFKQFKVMSQVYTAGNEIQSAIGTDFFGINAYGDFARSGTGEYGCHPTILTAPIIQNNSVVLEKNGFIVSNILYTKTNIQKIAKMKGAEKYMGDLSLPLDTSSANYRDSLCVNLDVGLYDDQESTQGLLTGTGVVGFDKLFNQRKKFGAKAEATAAGKCEVSVGNANSGFQRDLDNIQNDTQQLSNLWVKSRWNDELIFDRLDPQETFDTTFSLLTNQDGRTQVIDTTGASIIQVFGEGHTDQKGDFISQEEMNSWAKLYDVACVPFNVPINPAVANQNIAINQFSEPFIAFVVGCDYGGDAVFDEVKQFSSTASTASWKADPANFGYGSSFGIDISFTRNKAVALQNAQLNNNERQDLPNNFLNYINLGAVNPSISFDTDFSRFSISGLNTPLFIGNGLTTDDPLEFTPSDNPQQQILQINGTHQMCPSQQKDIGVVPPNAPGGTVAQFVRIGQFDSAKQAFNSIIDSQAGVSLEAISVYDGNNNLIRFDATDLTNQNDYLYHNTLFDKMGFDLDTLITKYGSTNAFFRNPSVNNVNPTYDNQLKHMMKPMTTGASLNANLGQTFSLNNENAPLFDLGGDTIRQVKPDAEQGSITAKRLASKFDFSYLCVYSSLIAEGTDTQYIGGSDNQSRLSCMTYLTRENNESDFFYQGEKGFNFTATKDFVITDITTDIRLPNGERPVLSPASTIIYKIEKPLRSLPQNAQPIPQRPLHESDKKK